MSVRCWTRPFIGGPTFLEGLVQVHCLTTYRRKVWPLSTRICSGSVLCSGWQHLGLKRVGRFGESLSTSFSLLWDLVYRCHVFTKKASVLIGGT
jgi:hypothetical protein